MQLNYDHPSPYVVVKPGDAFRAYAPGHKLELVVVNRWYPGIKYGVWCLNWTIGTVLTDMRAWIKYLPNYISIEDFYSDYFTNFTSTALCAEAIDELKNGSLLLVPVKGIGPLENKYGEICP